MVVGGVEVVAVVVEVIVVVVVVEVIGVVAVVYSSRRNSSRRSSNSHNSSSCVVMVGLVATPRQAKAIRQEARHAQIRRQMERSMEFWRHRIFFVNRGFFLVFLFLSSPPKKGAPGRPPKSRF